MFQRVDLKHVLKSKVFQIKQTEWDAYFDWCAEGSKSLQN